MILYMKYYYFSLQGGMYVFQIMDWYCAAFAVTIIAILESIIVAWIYGNGKLKIS